MIKLKKSSKNPTYVVINIGDLFFFDVVSMTVCVCK